ncbi:MAG: DUF4340 domain-containing protein [Deltaproteobacteria bacterium]|nr:DUF4340 domain-containing protein [Deltaproteobacteria bacterium]
MNGEPSRQRGGGGKTNLILAASLIAVCGFAYWLELRKTPQMKREQENSQRLVDIDQNREVELVKVFDRAKGLDVEMRCKAHCKLSEPNADWAITMPIAFKADESNVGTFITGVMASTVQETLPLEGDLDTSLQQFGLGKTKREEQKTQIKFTKDAEPYTIYLGDNAAVGENMYVYVTGPNVKKNVVRIVPSFLKNNVSRNLSYWRSKRLFNFSVSEVEGIALKNPAGTVALKREGADWYLPGKRLADNEAVDTFLTGLVFMNAQEFVSDDKNVDRKKFDIPVSRGHFSLSLKTAKSPDLTVEVYDFVKDKQPKLYGVLSDRNFIVSLERTNAERFAKKEDAFRFHNLLTAAEKQGIAQIKLRLAGKDSFDFKLDGTAWKLVSGTLESFDPASVDRALIKVGAARVAEFLGKKPVPKGTPELSSWTLLDKDGKKVREFSQFAMVGQGDYYVKLATGELAKMERGSGSAIPSKIADFKAPVAAPAHPQAPQAQPAHH